MNIFLIKWIFLKDLLGYKRCFINLWCFASVFDSSRDNHKFWMNIQYSKKWGNKLKIISIIWNKHIMPITWNNETSDWGTSVRKKSLKQKFKVIKKSINLNYLKIYTKISVLKNRFISSSLICNKDIFK